MRPSSRGHQSGPLLRSVWCRRDTCGARGWPCCRVRRREWLGRRDADERRDTDDADAIDPDGDRTDAIDPDGDCFDAIDPDCHGVQNDNRGRGIPAASHDNDLQCHNNVWSQSRRGRGRRRVAERRIEQHAVGLDRLCNSRGGGHCRWDRLVVAETLRPYGNAGAGGRRHARWIIVSPSRLASLAAVGGGSIHQARRQKATRTSSARAGADEVMRPTAPFVVVPVISSGSDPGRRACCARSA